MASSHEDRAIRTMKREFSTSWVSSKQPRKQRKYQYNAPLHVRHKFLNAPLATELRTKYGKRSIAVRKGDEAKIMRGSFADKKAKVLSVDVKRTRVTLEGITRTKKDGTKISVFFHPSKLQIVTLALDDKQRMEKLNVKNTQEKKNAPNKS